MASQVPGLSALTKPGLIPGFKVSKVAAVLSTYLLTRYFSSQSSPKSRVNMSVNKDSPKVVHSFDMEDIGNKAVYCRCWRSKKLGLLNNMEVFFSSSNFSLERGYSGLAPGTHFPAEFSSNPDQTNLNMLINVFRIIRKSQFPYCDGAHTKHNEETGDNVGPLIIKKKNP